MDTDATTSSTRRAVTAPAPPNISAGMVISDRYRLERLLGRGGMGQVWLARDQRLGRAVAIKVLAPEFSTDLHIRARLEREARAISALVHPNICTLYDVGYDRGTDYLVMEYLDGVTLAKRLEKGCLPLSDVLDCGAQIAAALAHAHGKGIIHRDLKPSNVMITKSGAKLLDFGLAKSATTVASDIHASAGPTAERPLTSEGRLIGTLSYMAPEQLEGKEADARTDIFALGTILYLMATGERPFNGDSDANVIASILKETPPPLRQTQPLTPPALDHVVEKCLTKDRDARWQSAQDVCENIRWIASEPSPRTSTTRRRWFPVAVSVAAGLVAMLATTTIKRTTTARSASVAQITFGVGSDTSPSLSPDGQYCAFVGRLSGGDDDVYVQRIGGMHPVNITEGCDDDDLSPAFSPDGKEIAYRSRCDEGIYVTGVNGESTRRITTFGESPAWSPDGQELAFTTGNQLWRVHLIGLRPRVIATRDAVRHPTWSPSGEWIAFTSSQLEQPGRLLVVSHEGGEVREIFRAAQPIVSALWSADGRFIYFAGTPGGGTERSIWRLPVDARKALAVGRPEQLTTAPLDPWGSFSISGAKVAYAASVLTWSIDRIAIDNDALPKGDPVSVLETRRHIYNFSPSPDGRAIAVEVTDPGWAIYTAQTDGTNLRRLTDETVRSRAPKWSTDGSRIFYISTRDGRDDVWSIDPHGSNLERITNNEPGVELQYLHLSPDGRTLYVSSSCTRYCTGLVDLTKPSNERVVEWLPPIAPGISFRAEDSSPDGTRITGVARFHARERVRGIESNHSIYIFNKSSRTYELIDNGSIDDPKWFDDDRILLYYPKRLMLLDLATHKMKPALVPDNSRGRGGWSYCVSRDRKYFYTRRLSQQGNIYMLEIAE